MINKIQTLLIAEDDDNDFLLFSRALEKDQFEAEIQRACDGVEAIEYLSGEHHYSDRLAHPLPDLLVLDLKMPRKGGFDVLIWLREHPELQSLRAVVFSSSDEPADIERAYALGAKFYLTKPTSFSSYPDVVRTLKELWLNGFEKPLNSNVPESFIGKLIKGLPVAQ